MIFSQCIYIYGVCDIFRRIAGEFFDGHSTPLREEAGNSGNWCSCNVSEGLSDFLATVIKHRAQTRPPPSLPPSRTSVVPARPSPNPSEMEEGSLSVELSLSGRGVTIGSDALAYLHDAACKGCEREAGGTGRKTRREVEQEEVEEEERQSEWTRNGIRMVSPPVSPRGSRKGARSVMRIRRGERGGGKGRREAEDSLSVDPAAVCYLYVACLPTRVTIGILFA